MGGEPSRPLAISAPAVVCDKRTHSYNKLHQPVLLCASHVRTRGCWLPKLCIGDVKCTHTAILDPM